MGGGLSPSAKCARITETPKALRGRGIGRGFSPPQPTSRSGGAYESVVGSSSGVRGGAGPKTILVLSGRHRRPLIVMFVVI